jgi:hypothetical protein
LAWPAGWPAPATVQPGRRRQPAPERSGSLLVSERVPNTPLFQKSKIHAAPQGPDPRSIAPCPARRRRKYVKVSYTTISGNAVCWAALTRLGEPLSSWPARGKRTPWQKRRAPTGSR